MVVRGNLTISTLSKLLVTTLSVVCLILQGNLQIACTKSMIIEIANERVKIQYNEYEHVGSSLSMDVTGEELLSLANAN